MTKTEFINFFTKEVIPYLDGLDHVDVLNNMNSLPETYDFSRLEIMFKNSLEKIKLYELGVMTALEAINAS